jgi:Zn-dependent protease with chaperone function
MNKFALSILVVFAAATHSFTQSPPIQPTSTQSSLTQSASTRSTPAQPQRITQYTLPPDRHQQAHELNRTFFAFRLISFVYGIGVLVLLLFTRLGPRLRDLAESISSKRFIQTLVFTPLLVIVLAVFELPADAYVHHLSAKYGLSIQHWSSWFFDWTKQQVFTVVGATICVWLLYLIIRRSSRRWWFYSWLVSVPVVIFLVFIQPLVLDPAFNKFEPLATKDPVLAEDLTRMAQRAGEDIPVDRMFWMDASEKTTTLNAYVTGVGASKRIVVWDTTIDKLTTPQIVFIAGHEMGHYVLHHIVKGLMVYVVGSLLLFVTGFFLVRRLVAVSHWGIRGVDDFASLPVMLLVVSVLLFVATPVINGISRYFEHQADTYALEITRSLTSDFAQVGAQTFQALGNQGLADPDPNPINVFMFYDHDPIRDRVKYCLDYDTFTSK